MIRIIESREQDVDALRNLFFKTRQETFYWADKSRFQLSDFEKETEGEYILVALSGEMVIGFVSVWTADNFIHHLYVDERYRNQQVGTQLLKAVIDKIDLPIKLKCEENNKKAANFYILKGFTEKERGQSETEAYILFELNKSIK
jgi:ribosomal protein S18 acetylase RimI-like enzyme